MPDGTLQNNELLGIIKRVSSETKVPANILAAVAQQETGGKWYDKASDGTGYSYGYMMLYDNGVIADLKQQYGNEYAEKAKTDPYTNVLAAAKTLEKNYNNYGNWQQALAKYNGSGSKAQEYGEKVWQRANSSDYQKLASGQTKNGVMSKLLGNQEDKTISIQNKFNKMYDIKERNPFLKEDGTLLNPFLDYQKLLNKQGISDKAKQYISEATGLSLSGANQTVDMSNSQDLSDTGNNIVDSASKYIGKPYVWGGESDSEGGYDCSGFVYNALKDAGYDVGRTTAEGYRQMGTTVDKNDLQAGDLVFYGSGNEATHVGIYIGNGKVVQSSGGSKNTKSNPGKGVCIKDLDYRNDYMGARRC